jgi:hypothetical protein
MKMEKLYQLFIEWKKKEAPLGASNHFPERENNAYQSIPQKRDKAYENAHRGAVRY